MVPAADGVVPQICREATFREGLGGEHTSCNASSGSKTFGNLLHSKTIFFFLHALVLLPFSSPSPSLLLAFQALTSESSYVNESVAFRCFDFAEKHGYALLM